MTSAPGAGPEGVDTPDTPDASDVPSSRDDVTDAPGETRDSGESGEIPAELLEIRRSIDNIDAALVHLLAERFANTQRVGRLKARYGLPPADPAREAVQIARLRSLAAGARLDPDFAEKFLQFLVEEVIRHHRAIAREEGTSAPTDSPEDGTSDADRSR